MLRIFKVGFFLLVMLSPKAFSQNYFNSPYTRYKIGDLIDDGFAYNRSLGGSSIGIRPHNQINYLNPASYTSQDTNSFLLQVGFTGRYAKINTEVDNDKSMNFNIEYLTIGFPVTRWWNISIGAVPFSRSQYFVRQENDSVALGEKITFDYSGFGGFNEFYIGNAIRIGKFISLGANASYLFGSIDRKQVSFLTDISNYSASIEQKTNYIASDFYFKLGAQVHPVIGKHKLVLGATYDLNTDINMKLKGKTTRFNTFGTSNSNYWSVDTLHFNIDTIEPLILPKKLSLGFSYSYNDIVMFTAEYIRQDWSGTDIDNSNFKTGLYESMRFGVEVVPVPFDNKIRTSYLNRMHYRAGLFSTKTYLIYQNKNIINKGLSLGLGLPVKYARKTFTGTTFDIGYQYGIRGTTENGLVKENTHIITFGLTLHDFWFLKPKYD